MRSRRDISERYELIVFENFEFKGQKRHKAHRVGTATISPKGGLVLYIPTGISITGRVLVVPEEDAHERGRSPRSLPIGRRRTRPVTMSPTGRPG